MSLKYLVTNLLHRVFLTDHLTQKQLIKQLAVGPLSNCCDYFLRLSRFPDILRKAFLINIKFS